LVLDRTAFYPEAGGQLADHGQLGGLEVIDVQVDALGVVHHLFDRATPLPAIVERVKAPIKGAVDRDRRRQFMALHTGQHMLSRALLDVARAQTVSSRLGESTCTIDVELPSLPDRALSEAESLVNSVIEDDVTIRAYFPELGELDRLDLRRKAKVEENVRVVEIGEFDRSPCGGTHCTRTTQVGWLRVTGTERYKGMTRIHFAAGRRARQALVEDSITLSRLAGELTCGSNEVPAALERLRRDIADGKERLRKMSDYAAEGLGRELVAKSDNGRVVAVIGGASKEFLRALAVKVAEQGTAVVLGSEDVEGLAVVAVGAGKLDCGALIKRIAQAAGGKGGGRPERAEGLLPRGSDLAALIGSTW
jgi:alanyl-tRNA synthetase